MIEPILNYLSIGSLLALTSISGGYAGGRLGKEALQSIEEQPQAAGSIMRLNLIALALMETSALLGFLLAFFMLNTIQQSQTLAITLSLWAMVAACGISGCAVALGSALPSIKAVKAIARQPFFQANILTMLLLNLSLIQTPVILGFLIALLIHSNLTINTSLLSAIHYLAGGLAIGICSIGTAFSLSLLAEKICWGLGVNRSSYSALFSFSFVSQAIIETPLIFGLLVSLVIIRSDPHQLNVFKSIAAALCIGIGTLMPSISSAKTARAAAHQIIIDPGQAGNIGRLSTVTQALIDALAIYALLISLAILLL